MIAWLIAKVVEPFKAWIAGLAIVLSVLAGVYFKGRSKGKEAVIEQINKENADAIRKADEARARARARFDAGGLRDDWTRD